ncbi:UNVERIFIED_CONTAM: hypothetical protein FKN15_054405 [Acipenser sinensis]
MLSVVPCQHHCPPPARQQLQCWKLARSCHRYVCCCYLSYPSPASHIPGLHSYCSFSKPASGLEHHPLTRKANLAKGKTAL